MNGLSYGNVLICKNGHLVTAKANNDLIPEKFCATCGDEIINTCLECGIHIKGIPRLVSQINPPYSYFADLYIRQAYCTNCGKPHPWTKRGEDAAYELIEFASQLTQQERDDWRETIPILLQDSQRTSVAVIKFKKYVSKAGVEIGKAVKDIVVRVVSEVVKDALIK